MATNYSFIQLIKFPSLMNVKTLFFSVLLFFVVKHSNPYKIPGTSSIITQHSSYLPENPHTVATDSHLDQYFKQDLLLVGKENVNNFSDDLNPNLNATEIKIEESSVKKRSIIDGILSLDELKKKIIGGKSEILEEFSIEELFNFLSVQVENFKEEFYLKGLLFKLIYNHENVRQMYVSKRLEGIMDFQADNVIHFLFSYNHFCEVPDEDSIELKSLNYIEKQEKTPEIVKLEEIIQPTRNFLDENRVFIRKFDKMFKFFWQHNFKTFQEMPLSNNKGKYTTDIFKLNKIVLEEYDYSDITYKFLGNQYLGKRGVSIVDSINLRIISNSKRNFGFFRKAFKDVSSALESFLYKSTNIIDLEKMYYLKSGRKILTLYGIQVLDILSLVAREKIYQNIGGNFNSGSESRIKDLPNSNDFHYPSEQLNKNKKYFSDILIQVQDWSTNLKCEEEKNVFECTPNINVIVGLFVTEKSI
ncbi:hypothetical protein EDEG_03556 [Edhazardia aedis USNM 41457]|uniref:Uncharacterized protein n=1 Tax=Edhazardia aedis (strain USNM 41457) TaxID=1003232 RepID=J9DHB1_EDHAE|nr:hypothetical protein EDEG_03556 [Edhazardia aedis USNM 41457]|eukprot:EJW01990.1 hypothetical protein EDEG_03556 [Edhazardia aedis USNM 41457]